MKDTLRSALHDLSKLQVRFAKFAEREADPTNRGILNSLFNESAIGTANAGINSFRAEEHKR
jgi:hypothetical protein